VTRLVLGFVLLFVALIILATASGMKSGASPRPGAALTRLVGLAILLLGVLSLASSSFVVIDAGQVGVLHAFGKVNPTPLLPGVRFVMPWSEVERFSTREEQWPRSG
jgi:hypothetical protein